MLLNWYLFSLRRTSGRLRFRQLLVVWYYRGTQAGPTKLSCQATFQAALLLDSREITSGVSSLSSISMRGFAELRLDYFAFFSSVSCRSSSRVVDCMWRTQTHAHTHTVRKKYTFLGFRERSFHHFGLWKLPVWIIWRQYILLSWTPEDVLRPQKGRVCHIAPCA